MILRVLRNLPVWNSTSVGIFSDFQTIRENCMMRHNFKTHVSTEEDFVLRLIQYRRDDNRVSPWMDNIMQSFPDNKRWCRRTCNKKGGRTDCVEHGFLPVLSDDERRLAHDSFHPPQTEYTCEPQEAQN